MKPTRDCPWNSRSENDILFTFFHIPIQLPLAHIPEYVLHWIKSLALASQPHHWHTKNIYTQKIIMLLQKYNQDRVHPVSFQRSSSLFS